MSGLREKGGDIPHFHGHRERLKEKFGKIGGEAFPDYELLELVLFQVIPRVDTKPLAKKLLAQFGSFAGVIGADRQRLLEIDGVGEAVVHHFKILHAAATRFARDKAVDTVGDGHGRALDSWKSVIDYCKTAMAYEPIEQFRILFLNKRNQLIADEVQQSGTVDHTPVYPREVVKRALQLSATAIILVHNHPSGDPTPSSADIQMTKQIVDVAKPLGIVVHDHIVVGRNGHASFKGLKLI